MYIPFAAIAPVLLITLGFVVYCLVDLIRAEQVRGLPRWAWAIVILASMPLGGIAYLLAGRQQ